MSDPLLPVRGDGNGLTVHGGLGGIRFQWEELEEASRVLALLAADAGDVAVALGVIEGEVSELPWRLLHVEAISGSGAGSAVSSALYREALADVGAARASARDSRLELSSTDDRLRMSLSVYRAADAAARAATEAVRGVSGSAARTAALLAEAGDAVDVGPIRLRPGRREDSVAFDGSVAGVLQRLRAVEAEAPGSFEVLTAGTPEDPVHVVVLPGTQTGTADSRAGSNPFDVGGIAEALTMDSEYTGEAVRTALADAGAREGDGLVLVGYSQGGLHAVNVAGPENLGADYDVRLVLTVGSPTGWDAPGEGEYLHLEHGQDAVPHLDGSANSDGRHRTTVSFDHAVPPLGTGADGAREPWGLGPAHKLENYAEGARLVDASDAPSLAPAVAVLAAAGVSGTARRHSFTAVRSPKPVPKPAPSPGPRPSPVPRPRPSPVLRPRPSPVPAPSPMPGPRPGSRPIPGPGSRPIPVPGAPAGRVDRGGGGSDGAGPLRPRSADSSAERSADGGAD